MKAFRLDTERRWRPMVVQWEPSRSGARPWRGPSGCTGRGALPVDAPPSGEPYCVLRPDLVHPDPAPEDRQPVSVCRSSTRIGWPGLAACRMDWGGVRGSPFSRAALPGWAARDDAGLTFHALELSEVHSSMKHAGLATAVCPPPWRIRSITGLTSSESTSWCSLAVSRKRRTTGKRLEYRESLANTEDPLEGKVAEGVADRRR